jgi:iron complex transport system substrate-binding protein
LSGALAQITQLGSLTGHVAQASKLTASMTKAINDDVASIAKHPTKKLTVFYEIGTKPYYSLTSTTFIGSILKSLGLVNIADAVATSADAGYPSLTPEYVLSSNPKMIITADAQSASDVSARSGFKNLSAVKAKAIVALNPNLASEWGPQLPQLVHAITAAVKAALANNTLWK